MGGEARSLLSKGGMKTKIIAAKMATSSGTSLIISKGSDLNPLKRLENNQKFTLFLAKSDPHQARKSWIQSMKSCGGITIDAGAELALKKGNSLLPAGVIKVTGDFERGDPVNIYASNSLNIGIGFVRYTSTEARRIIGARLVEVEKILGYPSREALIHRDDMAL